MDKNSVRFNYIVTGTEASQDGGPYVYITFSNPNESKVAPDCPFDPNATTITSPEDLMKNLPDAMANIGKAMSGGGGFPTDSPTFKISMREYEDMTIKVGDKVTIEIKLTDSSGV